MIEKRHKGERLLQIDNVHITGCGSPPSVDASEKYVGYFENIHGDQWVFIGDRKTGDAVVYGGDAGWETEYKISIEAPCPYLILNEAEKLWIITCIMGMSPTSFDEAVKRFNRSAPEI